jgi:hypothetical protein
MAQEKENIIVTGYPKSGNTWASRLVAEVLDCPVAGLWERAGYRELAMEGSDRASSLSVWKCHYAWRGLKRAIESSAIIHIVRDPRDVVCSGANYFNLDRYEQEHQQRPSKYEAMIDILLHGGPYPNCRRPWAEFVDSFPPGAVLTVRYEDLLTEPLSAVTTILSYLGEHKSQEHIVKSIEKQSFAERKALAIDQGDKRNLRFLRSGQSGSFRKELSPEQISTITTACKAQMGRYGFLCG